MIQVQDNDHIWNSLEKKVLINGKEFALTFKSRWPEKPLFWM